MQHRPMAIVSWPRDVPLGAAVPCAICGRTVPLDSATAGRCFATGRQAFACAAHSRDISKLITGWTEFSARQRGTHRPGPKGATNDSQTIDNQRSLH